MKTVKVSIRGIVNARMVFGGKLSADENTEFVGKSVFKVEEGNVAFHETRVITDPNLQALINTNVVTSHDLSELIDTVGFIDGCESLVSQQFKLLRSFLICAEPKGFKLQGTIDLEIDEQEISYAFANNEELKSYLIAMYALVPSEWDMIAAAQPDLLAKASGFASATFDAFKIQASNLLQKAVIAAGAEMIEIAKDDEDSVVSTVASSANNSSPRSVAELKIHTS